MTAYPHKLEVDAITEALCEFRFESDAPNELVVGKLSSLTELNGENFRELPIANIPAKIRNSDADIRYQPVLESIIDNKSKLIYRIGPHCLSVHVISPYIGGDAFKERIFSVLEQLLSLVNGVRITRIGYRYINFFTESVHGLDSAKDLRVSVALAEKSIDDKFSLILRESIDDSHELQTKLITGDLVTGPKIPEDLVATLDIDVFTKEGFTSNDKDGLIQWVKKAHDIKNGMFYKLIEDQIDRWK